MSLFVYLDGVVVGTTSIRLNAQGNQSIGALPSAADGTGSQGNIVFDDPTGALSIRGWQIVQVKEPDCTSAQTLFYGTTADHTERRGPYHTGAGREIDTTINDHNGFLSLRLIGGNALRPEETDTARLAWLLSNACLDGLVYDLGFVNGAGRTFEPTSYLGQYAADVLADLAGPRGQIFFTYWDQSAQKVGLFFDSPGATTFTSTLSISNVLSDITFANGEATGTVYPPHIDGELVGDPEDVYSRIRYVYKGGAVWRTNTTTQAAFFPPPLDYRSFQVENDRVGKQSTAITFADRILEADSEERETLKFTVRLPSTKVGLIQAGMRIHCKFSHLTGFTTGAYTRIERLSVVPVDGDPTHYDVSVECSTHGLASGGGLGPGTGGGSTTPFPTDQTPGTATHYAAGQIDYLSEGYGSSAGAAATTPGVPNSTQTVTGDASVTLTEGVVYNYHFRHILNAADLDTSHQVGIADGGTWNTPHISTPAPDTTILYEGSFTCVSANAGTHSVVASANGASHVAKAAAMEWWIDPDGWVTNEDPDPPTAGNPVTGESVTMTGATGSTSFAFATGSLRVFVDDIDHTDDIVSSDGALKTFTLDFIPYSFEVVRVDYIAG